MPRIQPLRERIAETIRARIKSGEYPPGSKLPTERELAAEFECSLEPVKTALDRLQTEGWIVGQQGRGRYVADPLPRS